MPRLQRNPPPMMSVVPLMTRMERPSRQREFASIHDARVSKLLASTCGISGSLTRRMIRGERPVSRPRFSEWLTRLMRDGMADVARAEVAIDAHFVGCVLQPLPDADELQATHVAVGELCVAASELAALVLKHLVDGVRTREEIEAELREIQRTRKELDQAEAALLAEIERMRP